MTNLEAALWYQKRGFSIIPAKRDKKPFIKWAEFQTTAASEVQIREWWAKWPTANIAIVTGKVSGITVLDADSQGGKESLEEFISDSISLPTVKTPHGWHFYFKWVEGLSNGVRVLNDCDIRSDGGYVVAPPSKNGSALRYEWVGGLDIARTKPVAMPNVLKEIIEQQVFSITQQTDKNPIKNALDPLVYAQIDATPEQQGSNNSNILSKGRRDNDLFRIANCLIKGGMPEKECRMYLDFIAKSCIPPFSGKEAKAKVQSAIRRKSEKEKVTTRNIREWISATSGNFLATNLYKAQHLQHPKSQAQARAILSRLCSEGFIERIPPMDGTYRRVDSELNKIDIFNVKADYLDIKYPLNLHEFFRTMPRNIILIAGTQNVGKTAFMMSFATMNMNRGMNIRYITSEMGGLELSERCRAFEPDIPFSFWKNVEFCDHCVGFKDKLDPDGINIIDFLEISDSFYKIAETLGGFYERLKSGIVVVALQKGFKQELGRGAEFSLEKPRLYVTMTANPPEGNIAKIIKCKNWARTDINPNGMECVFKVIKGSHIRQQIKWSKKGMEDV